MTEEIYAWALREVYPWLGRRQSQTQILERLERLNGTNPSLFLLRISGGSAVLRPKPIPPSSGPLLRAEMYRDFLGATASEFCPELDVTLGIYLEDAALNDPDTPVFAFQKQRGSKDILLPDPEFFDCDFYSLKDHLVDEISYEEKSCSAVFAGSTSGGYVTRQAVDERTHPRLRSALFFKGNPIVDFRLPAVVQYDSQATIDYLRSLGFGHGDGLSWQDQFSHRFIISMDGNGAACSRIPITLRSNSVLLKYASDHVLYYFDGMRPWLHYVPISCDEEVIALVEAERARPGLLQTLAIQGRQFAQTYLSRYQAMRYTALLLQMYQSIGQADMNWQEFATAAKVSAAATPGSGVALGHLAGRGDVRFPLSDWIGEPGSGRTIEGIAIDLGSAGPPSDLYYRTVVADGSLSAWTKSGEFCGSRWRNAAIRGLQFHLLGRTAAEYECRYSAVFTDGTRIGPVPSGQLCRSENLAPLEAFRLELIRKAERLSDSKQAGMQANVESPQRLGVGVAGDRSG